MSNTEVKIEDNLVINKKMNRNSVFEHGFINYISVPSLETIATIKVATGICKLSDIRNAMQQHSLDLPNGELFCRYSINNAGLQAVEKSILTKLSFIQLPNLLKEKVADSLTAVVLQMLQRISYGNKDVDYMDYVCWTIKGTIDKVKNFEQLVSKDSTQNHIKKLFELACTYCLEDRILNLWNKLPETLQNDYCEMMYMKYNNHLMAYWISSVKNELSGLLGKINQYDPNYIYNCNNSIYKNMFTLAVSQGNILAVKYFWKKLTNKEIRSNIMPWINYSVYNRNSFYREHENIYDYSEVLFFLLSQLDGSEQQKKVFQKHSEVILLSLFSDWPWRRFLLPTIQKVWLLLDSEVYLKLLSNIVEHIRENKIIPKLLRKLFLDSPINLKKCFIQYMISNIWYPNVFCKLLAVGDVETIKLILNYANVEEKKQIIFTAVNSYYLYKVFYADKLSLFDTLLGENMSSNSDIQNIKEKVKLMYAKSLCCKWIKDDNFEMVEKFFNWAFTSQEEIDYFKNKTLDKIEVTCIIIKKDLCNYELVDKFLGWCFSKDEDINDFKCSILQFSGISQIIYDSIIKDNNFEFPDNLINYCCTSNEDIKQFKAKFVLSKKWFAILNKIVNGYTVINSKDNYWESTRKFIKLFFPLEDNVTIKLKELIRRNLYFDDLSRVYRKKKYHIREEDLFRLIDNNYNIVERISSFESD